MALSVAANPAGTARTGTVTVAGQTFTVNQLAAACGAFSISPASQSNVAASGASLSVTVTGTAGCAFDRDEQCELDHGDLRARPARAAARWR